MLKGIDVSNWQTTANYDVEKQDFVIIKASEGKSYKDPMLDRHYNNVASHNKLYGFYHYARPENGNSAVEEADWFLSLVGHHKGKCLYILDWEGNALNCNVEWALQWLQRVEEKTGVKPLIYLQASQEWTSKYKKIIDNNYGLWIAQWGVNYPTVKNWQVWALWQYSDKPVDCNFFNGDKNAWLKYCGQNPLKSEPVKPVTKTFKVGDTVKIKNNIDYNGRKLDKWVLNSSFQIIQIDGSRVVLARYGQVVCAINKANIKY